MREDELLIAIEDVEKKIDDYVQLHAQRGVDIDRFIGLLYDELNILETELEQVRQRRPIGHPRGSE